MVLEMNRGGSSSGISDYLNCLVGHGNAIWLVVNLFVSGYPN